MRHSRRSNKENYPYSQNNSIRLSVNVSNKSYVFQKTFSRNQFSKPISIINNNQLGYQKYQEFDNKTFKNNFIRERKKQLFKDISKCNSVKKQINELIEQNYCTLKNDQLIKRNTSLQLFQSKFEKDQKQQKGFVQNNHFQTKEPQKQQSFQPKQLKSQSTLKNFETNFVLDDYQDSIIKLMKQRDNELTPKDFLKYHKVSKTLRAKMVDWMIEVLCSYKCKNQTFFLAVNYLDRYLSLCGRSHVPSDLHLYGVAAMFMACKYEEIYPFKLKLVVSKIGHNKLSRGEIKKAEEDIFKALDFDISAVTSFDIIMNTLYMLKINEIMNEKYFDYLVKVCVYLSKMNMYDYELINGQSQSILAASTIYVSFKIIEQLKSEYPLEQKVFKTFPQLTFQIKELQKLLDIDDNSMINCATKILNMAKNFEQLYPNYKNLQKFHSFTFNDKKKE